MEVAYGQWAVPDKIKKQGPLETLQCHGPQI